MQCFQKDPNLRVSARKLLKHPWIVSAKRSDAIVPKKPTEYDEAVKSVQEWNEALKSPNAGSLRRASRPMSSSPIPGRREPNNVVATPAKGPLSLAKPRVNAERFRSPSNTADDNWDDDFASAISPSALQLPHLRPHDNFGGLLSSEKLKAFASFETVTEEANWDDNFEGDLTMKSPLQSNESDPMETIRPFIPKGVKSQQSNDVAPTKPPEPKISMGANSRVVAVPADLHKHSPAKTKTYVPSTFSYTETPDDDFSDLIIRDTDFDKEFIKDKVGPTQRVDLSNCFRANSTMAA